MIVNGIAFHIGEPRQGKVAQSFGVVTGYDGRRKEIGEKPSFGDHLDKTTYNALVELAKNAAARGANAVVGLQISNAASGDNHEHVVAVTAYGEAVLVEADDG